MKKPVKEKMDDGSIMVISTHGRNGKLVRTLEEIERKSENISFHYVKKTAPSLRNILVRSKDASLGQPLGKTMPCNAKNKKWLTCDMVSKSDHIVGPDKKSHQNSKSPM